MKFITKQFLNDSPNETGYIVVNATTPKFEDMCDWESKCPEVSAQVQIGDCSQKIYLDFSITKDSHVQKRIDKLNVMINALEELKGQLPKMWVDAVQNAEAYKESNKIEVTEEIVKSWCNQYES